MSSVKVKFPSISIKRKPKSPSAASNQLSQSGSSSTLSQIFRPLTPEATRKFGGASQTNDSSKDLASRTDNDLPPFRRNASEGNLTNLEAVQSAAEQAISCNPEVVKQTAIVKPRPQAQRPSLVHRPESVTSFHDRSSSVNSETSYYSDLIEAPMIEQEDIIALTHHVRAFSEALGALRNTFFEETENDPPEVKAHERLGEVLSILKGVLNKYTPLHSTDILAAAGTLISKVKSHNYEESNDAPDEFCESIDQLALAFSSSVSDFLMGDQDIPLPGSRDHSRSLDDLCDEDEDDGLAEEDEDELDEDQDYADEKRERKDSGERREVVDKSAQKADELDRSLIGLEHGVDLTLQRSKIWSKYAKDIASYLERRAHLELEFTNKLSKLAQTTRASITEERYLPFQSIFVTSLDQDIEYAETCAKTYNSLLSTKFLEPLQARRTRHEQTRKELKDMWTKAYKKLNEAIVKLEKAKQSYIQRHQELEKTKTLFDAKDGQEPSASFSRTTKKKQDDIRKAEESEEFYNQCVSEANVRQRELERSKSHVLLELRQLIYQCDMTMKAVTCNYFQMMNTLAAPAPVRFQILAESSRAYEPGTQFADFVQEQMATSQPTVDRVFTFDPYSPGHQTTSQESFKIPARHNSAFESRSGSLHSPTEENPKNSPFASRRHRSLQISGTHLSSQLNSSHPPTMKAWTNRDHLSDVESNGSKSAPGSPNTSPSSGRRSKTDQHRELMESTDEESGNESDTAVRSPPRLPRKSSKGSRPASGPFRDCRMSHSALTHKFKKLRAPSKCRDCDSYVYFNGAECAQCGLTCHKKCLARLTSKCANKRSGTDNQLADYNRKRRMTTFGVDFYSHLMATDKQGECVPYIVSSCISEINSRGLQVKGIYRVSGVKSKVERLCQAFENDTEVVDLSCVPPHVIAAVLKLYLRQLPEPLLTFKHYPEFMKIAKESFSVIDNLTSCKNASKNESIREQYDELVRKLRKVVVKLPKANFKTAGKIIEHLNLVAVNEEENSMSSSNLGIVFGPTLLRPRESSSSDSVNMSALMDMPNQTRTVELLITNQQVFDPPDEDDPAAQETPVEDFSSSDRTKGSSAQTPGVRSIAKGKDLKGLPIETILTTEDGNSRLGIPASSRMRKSSSPAKLGIQNTPPTTTSTTRNTAKISLGFGNDFFELLAKSNERVPETEKSRPLCIPEFLLPGSADEREPGDESDLEDMDQDSNTQGTSGSQTPDDDLITRPRNIHGREVAQASHIDDSLDEKPRRSPRDRPSPEGSPREHIPSSTSMPEISNMPRSPSGTVSFGSDFQDADSLLPDLSDKRSEKKTFENFVTDTQMNEAHRVQRKTVDDAAIPSRPRRPHNLGLFKRNSDLPGMISRGSFFPLGMKNAGSEPDVANKSSDKRLNLFGSKKHPGITEALREIHHTEANTSGGDSESSGIKKEGSPRVSPRVSPHVSPHVSPRGSGVHMFPADVISLREGSHLYPTKPPSPQETEATQERQQVPLPREELEADEPPQLESKGIEPSSPSHIESKETKDHPPTPFLPKIKKKRFDFETYTIDSDSGNVVATKPRERLAQRNSNGEDKPGRGREGPPVAEKKRARQNGECLVSPDSKKTFEFTNQLEQEGKAVIQDNLPIADVTTTEDGRLPDSLSTSPAQNRNSEGRDVQDESEGNLSTEVDDKNVRLAHRVSVRDRKKQYEQLDLTDLTRKSPNAAVGISELSSRKQIFEESPVRYTRRDSYKKLNDLTKMARSQNPGLDGNNGSDTGSDGETRKERTKPLIGRNISERLERLDSSSRRRERIDTPERPRSLVLENLRVDKIESFKQEKYKTTNSIDRLSDEKPTFTSRKVDIPLDSPELEREPEGEGLVDSVQKPVDTSSGNTVPVLRSSPKPSRRSPRPPFPEEKRKREPQFV